MWWWGSNPSNTGTTQQHNTITGTGISTHSIQLPSYGTLNGSLNYHYVDIVVLDAIKRIQNTKEEEIVTLFVSILQYIEPIKRAEFLTQLIPFIQYFNKANTSFSSENIQTILDNLEPYLAKVDYNRNFKQSLKD